MSTSKLQSACMAPKARSRQALFMVEWVTYRVFIMEWREYRGLSQAELGARIGRSEATISQIESGKQNYTRPTLERIATILGCTPSDLLSRPPGDAKAALRLVEHLLKDAPDDDNKKK